MSRLKSLQQSTYSWMYRLAERPKNVQRGIKDTIYQLRTGEIEAKDIGRNGVKTLGAIILVGITLFPVYWIFLSSISGQGGSIYAAGGIQFIPADPTWDAYRWVFGNANIPSYEIAVTLFGYEIALNTPGFSPNINCSELGGCSQFPLYFWNSLTVSIPAVILAMCVIVPGAYALSRREFIFKNKVLYTYLLFTQIGGGLSVATLIALYAIFVQFGLTNDKLALAAYYAAVAVPLNTWILKTYMDTIPATYEEAAFVDGAPMWRIVWEIILPMTKPGLAATFIFTFLVGWKEFVVAQVLLSNENYTLPVGLFSLVGQYQIPWQQFSAFALVFALPVTIIYLAMRKYMQEGLSLSGID
ncbi:sugar ABC transporter permease [Haloarcula amylovorans]|uniref:sugar ABC transporter permease n=1 Tax=Haloarcula amylovorans TaxID=2562280 RepID=UPI001FD7658F|nr:ABC transporter permease subunit [Halomicroarcula amylolytica]